MALCDWAPPVIEALHQVDGFAGDEAPQVPQLEPCDLQQAQPLLQAPQTSLHHDTTHAQDKLALHPPVPSAENIISTSQPICQAHLQKQRSKKAGNKQLLSLPMARCKGSCKF